MSLVGIRDKEDRVKEKFYERKLGKEKDESMKG